MGGLRALRPQKREVLTQPSPEVLSLSPQRRLISDFAKTSAHQPRVCALVSRFEMDSLLLQRPQELELVAAWTDLGGAGCGPSHLEKQRPSLFSVETRTHAPSALLNDPGGLRPPSVPRTRTRSEPVAGALLLTV